MKAHETAEKVFQQIVASHLRRLQYRITISCPDINRSRVDDLSRTIQDPLLAKVRGQLRKGHGFTRDAKKKFGVEAVFSTEPLRYPAPDAACELPATGPAGLNCAGFGSIVTVTACVGMFAAARAINALAAGR